MPRPIVSKHAKTRFVTGLITLSSVSAWSLAPAADLALPNHRRVEIRANTFTGNLQERSALAVDRSGKLLAVWASRRQEAGTYGVFAQRFDPLGRPLGTEIHVNQFLPSAQSFPASAFDPEGSAWIVWQSAAQDGSGSGVYLRRFGLVDGVFGPLGEEQLVNITTAGDQFQPSVLCGRGGGALVAWSSVNDRSETRIVARLYRSDGSPASGELQLSAESARGRDHLPSIAHAGGGEGFLVAWAHTTPDHHPGAIIGRFVEPGTGPSGEPFPISDPLDTREQIEPSIAGGPRGELVCAWMRSREAADGYDIVARRIGAAGEAIGAPFVVADQANGWRSGVAIAMAEDGRFAISYNEDGTKEQHTHRHRPVTPSTLFARLYDRSANPQGEAFRVNRDGEGRHAHPAASNAARSVWSAQDQLAFVWDGHVGGDRSGTGLTLFTPESLRAPDPPETEPRAAAVETQGRDLKTAPDFDPDWIAQPSAQDLDAAGPDFGFMAFQTTGWQPPDPDCAAGAGHIVSVVNMTLRVHTKEGTLVSDELLEDFFAATSGGDFLFDPVALHDHHADRFVIATADHQGSQDGLNVAVSRSNDPADGWHKYYFDTDAIGDFIDFENLGVGVDAYYITADYFGSWRNVIHILEKTPMLSGDPVTLRHHRTANTALSLGAVKSYDPAAPAQYFASSWISSTKIRVYALRDPLGSPIVDSYDVTVPFFTNPPDATQKGSSNKVSTIDDRIKNGVYRAGSLWLTHSIGENSTARVRWYEIAMNGWPVSEGNPALEQSGTLNFGSGEHNWFPDVSVSDDGDAIITCSRSSSNDYPYIARAGRKSYDASSTFRHSVRLKESDGPTTSDRWGDYSGNDEDPIDPGVVWSHAIYNTTGSNWRTWVARVDTDNLMVLDDPGPLTRGANATITLRGAKASGTIHVAYSLSGPGETDVPQLDATLDLADAESAGSTAAAPDGSVTFGAFVPASAPVGPIYIQVIEQNNTSNLIATTIE
ncbi:MAG: hypothetical protein CME06_13280 [Gemmatimonadetes bacterium]|nr:hypothetical protein [Gemmatimonadota bacterium]